MKNVFLGVILGVCSIEDMKKRKISVWILVVGGILGLLLQGIERDTPLESVVIGMLLGGILLLFSLLSHGGIGMGDGWIVLVAGIFLGGSRNLQLLCNALMLAALFSMGVLFLKKGNGKKEIPFLPFLFLGYCFLLLGECL